MKTFVVGFVQFQILLFFFDFYSKTEFNLVFLENQTWNGLALLNKQKSQSGLPFAVMIIHSKDNNEVLLYSDINISCDINLITDTVVRSDIESVCVPNLLKVQNELLALIRKLEKM